MRTFAEEQVEGVPSDHPKSSSFKGCGTLENPFRPNALDEEIEAIARLALETEDPKYCTFENSLFRIHPNGNVEWSHHMPPLRDGIADVFENALRQFRENLQ